MVEFTLGKTKTKMVINDLQEEDLPSSMIQTNEYALNEIGNNIIVFEET